MSSFVNNITIGCGLLLSIVKSENFVEFCDDLDSKFKFLDTVWGNLNEDDEKQVNATTTRIGCACASCFAQTVQLVVKDGMDNKVNGSKNQNMKAALAKCTKISSLCHQSCQFKEAFEETIGKGR